MEIRETILTYLREECFISPNTGGLGNYGCMDPLAYNYDWQATDPCGSVIPDPLGANCVGDLDWNGPGTPPGDCCCGCKDPTADNYCVNCVGDCDGCGYPPPNPLGVGDPTSCCNYPTPILGCTDTTACNYISTANMDDGSCEYTSCLGCTDATAINYNASATIDDGSCTYGISGCTDPTATNYDPAATIDDGSCEYIVVPIPYNFYSTFDCNGITNNSLPWFKISFSVDYPGNILQSGSPITSFLLESNNITNNTTANYNLQSSFYGFIGTNYDAASDTTTEDYVWNYQGSDQDFPQTSTFNFVLTVEVGGPQNSESVSGGDVSPTCYIDLSGCTDPTAFNYDANATIDDGSCIDVVYGCTDPLSFNYDATATVDDGSCKYKPLDCKDLEKGCWVCKDPINFPSCQQITTATQLTLTLSYGLPGFTTQQDCINNTPCGRTDNNTSCGKLDNYVMVNYANWQGMGPLDTVHFCEKCKYQGLNDPMCKCCKEDPCNKISFTTNVKNDFNLQIDEFCKYCKSGDLKNKLCRCCKRFDKTK
tara:strand:+ start:1353 stop:2966 length:1614 start_codon:yes stop_codon:yes gene_type:complete